MTHHSHALSTTHFVAAQQKSVSNTLSPMGDRLRSTISMGWWCHCLNLCTAFCLCCPGCSEDEGVGLMLPLLQLHCSHTTARPVGRWSSGVFGSPSLTHHPQRFITQGLWCQLPDLNFVWLSSQALLFLMSSNH